MAIPTAVELDRSRIAELTAREEQRLNDSTKQSQQMYQRATKSLSGGVASSYQLRNPWPIYLERGAGCNAHNIVSALISHGFITAELERLTK